MYNLKKHFIFLGEKFEKKKLGLPRLLYLDYDYFRNLIIRLRLLQKTTLRSITRLQLLLKKAANLFGHHCLFHGGSRSIFYICIGKKPT